MRVPFATMNLDGLPARPRFAGLRASAQHARPVAARAIRVAAGALVLACAGFAPAQAQAQTQAQTLVGYTQLELAGVPVTMVYPTATPSKHQAFGPFELDVAVDATPLPAERGGRRRLVVTSHGTAGSPLPDHGIAAALARAGFVVAQPLHAGDNFRDAAKAGPDSWVTRPAEVSKVIDALASHPRWGALLQLDKVGVHGTSAGGATALSLAGAQWSTLALVRHCGAQLEKDVGFCFNGAPDEATQARRRASFERARGVPDTFLPAELKLPRGGRSPGPQIDASFDARPDPRVGSVTVSVPVGAIFSPESLARVRVPVGVVVARDDDMLLPEFHALHVLRHCTACTLLADLPGATHFDVMHPWPAATQEAVRAQQVRGVRTSAGFDARLRDSAYDRIVQFHRKQLAGD